jgi:diguanylate cyclase
VALARRSSVPFAVLLLDLDHFKNINDTHGHDSGDLVLQQAADIVTACVRVGDFTFRYGGEELLVVLVEIDLEQAKYVAETIRARFAAEPLRVGDGKTMPVTVSIGVAAYKGNPDYEKIVKEADEALYRAKNNGRNRIEAA